MVAPALQSWFSCRLFSTSIEYHSILLTVLTSTSSPFPSTENGNSKYWEIFFPTLSMLAASKFILEAGRHRAAKSNFYKNFILFSGKFTFELSVRWQKTSSSRAASQQSKSSLKMFRYRPFLLRETTDQQKLRIWALFTQWKLSK